MNEVFPTTLAGWRQRRHWYAQCPQCHHDIDHHKIQSGDGECFAWHQPKRMGWDGRMKSIGRAQKCQCQGPHISPFAGSAVKT